MFKNADNLDTSLTTLTLFGYGSVKERIWAFGQMGLAGRSLSRTNGLRFWRMLGSGNGGGFSLQPNWARYGLICAWKTAADADNFFASSPLMAQFSRHADEIWTVRLLPIKSHGAWGKQNPFVPVVAEPKENKPIAVLTRATINLRKLKRFWSFVPGTSKELNSAPGLIASIGIGEAPFVRQATFSLWQSEEAVKSFAYQGAVHREVIKLTRRENWYQEELFARFVPIASEGTWSGRDPLAGLL